MTQSDEILSFWFEELTPEDRFAGGDRIDNMVRDRFQEVYDDLAPPDSDLEPWLATPEGSLAAVIVLDQFPRNLFRDSPCAFATDDRARKIAEAAIDRGHDLNTHVTRRVFFYLPFEHSEDLAHQDLAVKLIRERADINDQLEWAERHCAVIKRFGRFPHRNEILGRASTANEIAYLESGGERFGAADAKDK